MITTVTITTIFALYFFIVDFLIPRHNVKTKIKQQANQEAEERRKVEILFSEYPTLHRNGQEWESEDFHSAEII